MPVLPHPLPAELVKGEHIVLADLLKLIPGSSSQEDSGPEPLVRSNYIPSSTQDPKPAPQAAKEKKKKVERVKAIDEGLEGFVDWGEPTANG